MVAKNRFEHLLTVISSQRFLSKQGLGNEVPFFICPFEPSAAFEVTEEIALLCKRLAAAGCSVLSVDLYELSLSILEERGLLDEILEVEK